jgi:exodeoxyribonuclease VII large subunit
MLNPQRTLERGYAVILSKEEQAMHAVRSPKELNTESVFEVRLADGSADVLLANIKLGEIKSRS